MRFSAKASRVLGAAVLMLVAALILAAAGLPKRSDYTGTYTEGLGRVAPEINAFAPPINARLLGGSTVAVPSPHSIVLINFWATWCAPCEAELPILQALHNEGEAFVLAVNMGEPSDQVERWLSERALTLPVTLDPDLVITRLYHVRGQPSTYVVRPDGRIGHIVFGAASEATLRSLLQP
ncbi:TlpA disulfide reductase family protein [Aggregatilineales bacterium SYSU G02658]